MFSEIYVTDLEKADISYFLPAKNTPISYTATAVSRGSLLFDAAYAKPPSSLAASRRYLDRS